MALLSQQIPGFLCPDDQSALTPWNKSGKCFVTDGFGRICYGGNYGTGLTPDAARMEGIVPGSPHIEGVFGYNSKVCFEQIHDGTSNTLLLAELIVGHECTMRGAHSYDEGPVVMVYYGPNDPTPDWTRWCDPQDGTPDADAPCVWVSGFIGETGQGANSLNKVLHTSRSYHPGGVQVALCDGSSRFVSQTIALGVWHALGTPNGGEIINGDF